MNRQMRRQVVSPSPLPRRARGPQEEAVAAQAVTAQFAVMITMSARCNRIRTDPAFLHRYYQERAKAA